MLNILTAVNQNPLAIPNWNLVEHKLKDCPTIDDLRKYSKAIGELADWIEFLVNFRKLKKEIHFYKN